MPTPEHLAILFADISGSTGLYENLGDVAARREVARCLSLLSGVIQRHGGTVVKTIGDEVMAAFPTSGGAVDAACEMQAALSADSGERLALSIRVGLHFGPTLREAGDVFGDTVNLAARLVGLAKAGQILTTGQTVEKLKMDLQAWTRRIDRIAVRGKRDEVDVREVIWRGQSVTRMGPEPTSMKNARARLRLRMSKKLIDLDQDHPEANIGRGKESDLVLNSELASRQHARIEYRNGKFFLRDRSVNGTFVSTQDGDRIYLHLEEMMLRGAGMISLSRDPDAESAIVIHFTSES